MTKSPFKLSAEDRVLIARYREHFVNTGGNEIEELIERPGVNFFNNHVAAALQVALFSQLGMLKQLQAAGLLVLDADSVKDTK